MTNRLSREQLAALEVGHTEISRGLSAVIVVVFLVLIVAVPLAQMLCDRHEGLPGIVAGLKLLVTVEHKQLDDKLHGFSGIWQDNNRLLAAMGDFEEQLEKSSFLRSWLLAPGQRLLLALGCGNEKVYPGQKDWLFYRPDMDYLMGHGFLDSDILKIRRLAGKVWENPIQPDPVAAILDFNRQLHEKGIRLVLMPTPIKASLHPDFFTKTNNWHLPLQNRSWQEFLDQMSAHNIDVFDPAPQLKQLLRHTKQPQYLKTDTHWRPEAMEAVARELAQHIQPARLAGTESVLYKRAKKQVTNSGDIAAMLRLDGGWRKFDWQEVEIHPVLTKAAELWQPVTASEVLLLGDSFANIYSLSGMGWGEGSGLGEQLSYYLDKPVDVLLQNDSGAFATRELLARELARGRDRLAGKKVVIWQFASRELSSGNWKYLDMELKERPESDFFVPDPGETLQVKAVVASVSRSQQPGAVPYKDNIITLHLVDVRELDSGKEYGQALVYCWGMRDNVLTRFARVRAGQEIELQLVDWDSVAADYSSYRRSTLDDEMLELELPVWGEIIP